MMTWIERRIFTTDQIITIQQNESMDCIVLKINEMDDSKAECRLYLTFDEAMILVKQLYDYVNDVKAEG